MNRPTKPGWYWFLPSPDCINPLGNLSTIKPVVLCVTNQQGTLVVRLSPTSAIPAWDLRGDWQEIQQPQRMLRESRRRIASA